MVEKTVTVTLDTGLQARPAAEFVQKANRYTSDIYLEKDNKKINAKSIMGLMSLAITKGEQIKLIAEGPDEESALNDLISFITASK